VGRFAGFDLLISPMLANENQLVLRGAAQHSVRLQATAHGTTRAVEHVVNHLDEAAGQAEEFLAQSRKRLADLHAQVNQPFEYVARLQELVSRQQKLVLALDLTKNQAKAIPSESIDVRESGESVEAVIG
jgi:ABC-type transporter Mla subunit MlaD